MIINTFYKIQNQLRTNMKQFSGLLLITFFSNCRLIDFYHIQNAMQAESIEQQEFKQVIPFRFEKGVIIVDVMMHNKLQSFVFDTGASTVLDDDFAKTIPYQKIGSQKHYDPTGHKRMVRSVQLEPFSIGNIRFKKIVASVSKLTTLKNTICVDIVGILGANAMNKAVWQIDFQQKKIILTNSKDSLAQRTDNQIFSFYAQGKKTPKIRLSVAGNYITEADFDTGSIEHLY
jgi:hypothetical protein